MLPALPLALVLLQTPASVTLRYQPALNKPYRYSTVASMTEALPGRPSSTIRQQMVTVLKATSRTGGRTKIVNTNESVKVAVPPGPNSGIEATRMAGRLQSIRVETTMDPQGRILGSSATSPGSLGMNLGMIGRQAFHYPAAPVKVGTTWQIPLDLAKMGGARGSAAAGKVPITMKVQKIVRKGPRTFVHLSVAMKGKLNFASQGRAATSNISSQGTLVIDASTGLPVTQEVKTSSVTPLGRGRTLSNTTFVVARQL
ncbi:MAG TPA: hypothetical protein VGE01_12050 [Fimbriimonas sp.]